MISRVPDLIVFARSWLGLPLSAPQEVLLRAIGGLPMPKDLLPLWTKHSGREKYEPRQWTEVLALCGRRSGKDHQIATTVATHESLFRATTNLAPGEVPRVVIVAQDLRGAGVAFSYCRAKLRQCEKKLGARIILAERKDELELQNAHGQEVVLGVYPCTTKAVRGTTIVCAICDELSFWFDADRFQNPAEEVLTSIRPAMATVPGAKLILATTPWAKAGIVWDMWQKRDERDDVLVFHATTADMNPTIPAGYLAREKARDPDTFRREYEAEFVDSVSAFLAYGEVIACVDEGIKRRPPCARQNYFAALDPSSRREDTFTLAVGHPEDGKVIVDLVHGWPAASRRFISNEALLEEVVGILRQYRISRAVTDQYGYEFLKDDVRRLGVDLEERPASAQSKAKVYISLKGQIICGQLRLVDHEEAIKELVGLELRSSPGGMMRFEAPRGRHDDYASAISLLSYELTGMQGFTPAVVRMWSSDD